MIVDGVGTRRAFPDYIARRPAIAMYGCKQIGDFIQYCLDNGHEIPYDIPPFGVLMYLEMIGVIKECAAEGVAIGIQIPPTFRRWI